MRAEQVRPEVSRRYTIVALLEAVDQVVEVVRKLHGMGLTADKVSLLAKDQAAVQDVATRTGTHLEQGVGAADDVAEALEPKGRAPMSGAVLGGAVGFLIGLTALAIPGFGPFLLASGPVAIALHSLTVSAAGLGIGALFGAIFDERVTEDHRELYLRRLDEGWWMMLIDADDTNAERVASLLEESRVAHVDAF
jgi:hypothetical protein